MFDGTFSGEKLTSLKEFYNEVKLEMKERQVACIEG